MIYAPVVQNEGDTPVELPIENDSTLLLTTLQAAFPNACGLVYKNNDNGALRGVRLVEGSFHPPEEGWEVGVFQCTTSREEKRKSPENGESPSKKKGQMISDLIILGLPWKTTEEQVREYFEKFGQVTMATVKKNPRTGQSKGFGFVRFDDFSVQTQVISQRHQIDGRWCDVKIPYSQAVDASQACKIFVGQLKSNIGQEEIKEYFSEYGDVSDIYIPQPFRMFAFVTFADPFTAKAVCAMSNHAIKGSPINVSVAIPPSRKTDNFDSSRKSISTGTGRLPLKRRHPDNYNSYEEASYFNTSGEWNSKQNRNSLLWDETPWDIDQCSGYTTVREMGF